MAEPFISVVVSAYSMERYSDLLALIDSLKSQAYTNFEVILVIEKSSQLFSCLNRCLSQHPHSRNFKLFFNDGLPGLASARNLGVEKSQGEIIAFIDDDAAASPEWLACIARCFTEDKKIIGLTGPALPWWEHPGLSWFPAEFNWIISTMPCLPRSRGYIRNAWGTNMAFRRDAFDSGQGFDTELGAKGGGKNGKSELVGEDTEFCLRICRQSGLNILYAPEVKVMHRVYRYRLKPGFIAKRAYWEGYTKAVFKYRLSEDTKHEGVLTEEWKLLKRIFLRLLPLSLLNLPLKPRQSVLTILTTMNILGSAGWGYLRGLSRLNL
ncbi:glycosyltransferase family 2 protein [Dehalococcoides mccartyi]|uniref:Group 2 glycosyl transferase n=1 Tax=Dehalococcoides mccartyi (strain VS) TaxID=311424 RepID=D2BGB2_DEHMV|nr:glycosyltransferase [Dehalococcoides mccartyi]ACZ61362.1 group 2 glycosyl transferase [Dehalococcoides mccartyi VS]